MPPVLVLRALYSPSALHPMLENLSPRIRVLRMRRVVGARWPGWRLILCALCSGRQDNVRYATVRPSAACARPSDLPLGRFIWFAVHVRHRVYGNCPLPVVPPPSVDIRNATFKEKGAAVMRMTAARMPAAWYIAALPCVRAFARSDFVLKCCSRIYHT